MIQIADHAEGCVLTVRAQPGARRNGIVGAHGDALKVSVTASPDKGRANDALVEVLAESLGLTRSQIALVSGTTSRQKKFLVRGVTAEILQKLLHKLMQV